MKKYDRKNVIALFVIVMLGLNGCSTAKVEKPAYHVSIAREEIQSESSDEKLTTVKRGSKSRKDVCQCYLTTVHFTDLNFGIDHLPVDAIYVKNGQHVKKGELLAKLDLSDLETKESDCHMEKVLKEEELRHSKKIYDIHKKKSKYLEDETSRVEYMKQMKEEEKNIDSLEEELRFIEKRAALIKENKEKRLLYAPYNGVIQDMDETDMGGIPYSDKNVTFACIYGEEAVFQGRVRKDYPIKKGQKYEMYVDDVPYEVMVSEVKDDVLDQTFSLQVIGNHTFLEGASGTITFVEGAFKDDLYVDSKAILTIDGKKAVYRLDENGFREIVEVETGLETGKVTQIKAGLKEGEQVVLL